MAEEVRNLLDQMDLEKNSNLVGVVEAAKKLRGLVGKRPETYQPLVLANEGFILANFLKINDLVMDQRVQFLRTCLIKLPSYSHTQKVGAKCPFTFQARIKRRGLVGIFNWP